MIATLNKRYQKSDFINLPGNRVYVDLETDYINSNEATVDPRFEPGDERLVFGCVADNMRLPFPDEHFDCYISNLSLMIVPDYLRQITECYRVLKPKSRACFAVWGRPENSILFTAVKLASERLGRPPVAYNAAHDNFHISKNRE
jgi:ubiquinone/menaquinone biosynthesis C-methylase UbiE